MFADAFAEAVHYTRPFVLSCRTVGGQCANGVGTLVLLNDEGWAVSCAHIFKQLHEWSEQIPKATELMRLREDAENEPDMNKRRARLKRLRGGDDLVIDQSAWFGNDGANIVDGAVTIFPHSDIALFRLEGVDLPQAGHFPKFKRPNGLRPGTSLLKLGYPFHTARSEWDEATHRFRFERDGLALMPIEGIFTRNVRLGTPAGTPEPDYPNLRLETSSPGLRGQSGGPTVDRYGVVWAIQSQTQHFDLGFSPTKHEGNKATIEHQFFNAGWGIHPKTPEVLFERAGVVVEWVD
jgi:hypothetical protein